MRLATSRHLDRFMIGIGKVGNALPVWYTGERAAEFVLERAIASDDQYSQALVGGFGLSWGHDLHPTAHRTRGGDPAEDHHHRASTGTRTGP